MKTTIIILLALLIPITGSTFELDISKTIEFGTGMASAIAVHEAGHLIVLEYHKRDYTFFFEGIHPRFTYSGESKNSIQMAGLAGQMVVDECVAVLTDENRRTFWQGYLFGSALNEILYPALRYTQGDFKHMHGREKALFAGLSIAHGCLNLFRLYRDDQLSITSWVGASDMGTPMAGFTIRW